MLRIDENILDSLVEKNPESPVDISALKIVAKGGNTPESRQRALHAIALHHPWGNNLRNDKSVIRFIAGLSNDTTVGDVARHVASLAELRLMDSRKVRTQQTADGHARFMAQLAKNPERYAAWQLKQQRAALRQAGLG